MDFLRSLRRLLPHLVLALMVCVNVLQVLHIFHPGQRFMTSLPSVILISSATVLSTLLSIIVIVKDNRRKKNRPEK